MNEVLFIETNPGPVKTALGLMGKIDPELRLPLAPMYPENEAKLRQVMTQYGLLGDERRATRDEQAVSAARAD
jgi:4-hydroxy-tetrahydrodipicolinate synthase